MQTKWLKRTLIAMFTLVGIGFMVGLSQAATLSFQGVTETGEDLTIDDTYFYSGCYTPVKIMINPEGVETHAVDAKFFTTGSFELQPEASDFLGFVPGVFSNYLDLGTFTQDDRIGEGTATVGTDWMYYYINAYTNTGDYISGSSDQDYATVYVKPLASATSGYLDFYFQGSAVNDDDSNVASGINNYTQYEDALTSIAGTGSWTIDQTDLHLCIYNPYILEWATYDSTLGNNLTEAIGTLKTSLATLPGYRVFTTPAPFADTISHMAGNDFTPATDAIEGSWDIWTNQPIVITISGNDYDYAGTSTGDFKMVTGIFASDYMTLDTMVGSDDAWTPTKTITVTGNVEADVSFYNRIGNYGSYFQSGINYFDTFKIDVFRYDNTTTIVNAATVETGDGYEVIGLSGLASTDATSGGFHADWTIDDDKFRIIKFSGHNTTKYGQLTTTSYNNDLNALYVTDSNQNFNTTKTGEYQTTNLVTLTTSDTGAIVFTETWTGYIRYSDIAGNTSGVYVEVFVDKLVNFEIKINPAYRSAIGNLSTTGELRIAQSTGAGEDRSFTHKYADGDGKVVIGEGGTGDIDIVIPVSGNHYLAVFKGSGYLSVGFTGIRTNHPDTTADNFFDFSSGGNNTGTHTDLAGGRLFGNIYYLLHGDLEIGGANYDLIETANEITLINMNLEIGTNDLSSIYRYDADLNDVINAVEQSIVIQDNLSYGFIGLDFVSNLNIGNFTGASL